MKISINKFTLHFIHYLDNYNLENERRFDAEAVDLLIAFFERFQKPICLGKSLIRNV